MAKQKETMLGIFNSEGLVEGDFYSRNEAEQVMNTSYDKDDDLFVSEVCIHGNELGYCEECGDFS